MTLSAYLKLKGVSPRDFAGMVGATESAVRFWINGHRTPRGKYISAISRATEGAVGPADWFAEAA